MRLSKIVTLTLIALILAIATLPAFVDAKRGGGGRRSSSSSGGGGSSRRSASRGGGPGFLTKTNYVGSFY